MTHSNNNTNKTVAYIRREWCDTAEMPLQKLLWRDDGTYLLVKEGGGQDSEHVFFDRSRSLTGVFEDKDAIYPVGIADERELVQVMNNSDRFVFARQCTCLQGRGMVFCPVEANRCHVWK